MSKKISKTFQVFQDLYKPRKLYTKVKAESFVKLALNIQWKFSFCCICKHLFEQKLLFNSYDVISVSNQLSPNLNALLIIESSFQLRTARYHS